MLLDYMRRKAKTFLYITVPVIAVAFVLWGSFPNLGDKGRQTLIKVGDQKVTLQRFIDSYKNLREMTRARFGANYRPELEEMLNLKQQALDRMIRGIILQQEIDRLNIVVSDREVQDSIKRIPEFYTDDKFDPAKWNAAINNPRIDWNVITEQERETLSVKRLMEIVESGARVTEEEIEEEYRRQNEKAKIEFAAFKADEFIGEVKISPAELESYYEQHKQQYSEPAQIKLAYVELKKEPSQEDSEAARKHAEDILERVKAGDDFTELAEFYSDDTGTKSKGGDLGFFGRGRMVKEFEEIAFSLKPGEVGDLAKTEFGHHIIKVEETRGEGAAKEVRAKHILVKVVPSEETLLSLEEQAIDLAGRARNSSLEEVASQMQMELSTTPQFAETSRAIPGIGYVPEVAEIIPGLGIGKASDSIDTTKAIYVVQVAERIPERIPELTEVAAQVRVALESEKALALAEARAGEIMREINEKGQNPAEIEGLPEPQETLPFTRRGYPPELAFLSENTSVVFELPEGKVAGPFINGDTAYIVLSREIIPSDPQEYETAKEMIKNRLLVERRGQIFEDYYQNLREKASVKINSDLFEKV
jgi:peptidyl-prolyl cis-trans isomerase D